ncbi:MAG TPA: hypothetical protein VI341_13670 [Actinomycetota bacterium]
MKPPTKKAKLAAINEVLVINARALGEPQRIFVTDTRQKDWIRIGEFRRWQGSRQYPNIDAALAAAWEAFARCRTATGDPGEHQVVAYEEGHVLRCLICGKPARTAGDLREDGSLRAIHAVPG